jgi:hypothetical protein
MVKVAVPVFLIIKAWDELMPTTAFPKLMDAGLGRMAGAGAGFTVSVAALLVTVPAVLLTTAVKPDPLSEAVVADVV